jgi:hypothetical protein
MRTTLEREIGGMTQASLLSGEPEDSCGLQRMLGLTRPASFESFYYCNLIMQFNDRFNDNSVLGLPLMAAPRWATRGRMKIDRGRAVSSCDLGILN